MQRYRLWLDMQVIFSAAAALSLPSLHQRAYRKTWLASTPVFVAGLTPSCTCQLEFDALDIQNQSMHVVHALQIDAKCNLHSHAASRPVSLVLASLNSVSSLVVLLRCPRHSPIL